MNELSETARNVFACIGFVQTFAGACFVIALCVWNGVEHDDGH